ncbi:MAG: hypothetical protein KME23_17730 [Goleter apudmare HA4340-LM2]|nr:hypothetical protein [Goleter apudmare HA4340-LM2]MBW4644802.1 hypothetical protein [Goleter apudmare HA4340-LM2]
MNKAKQPPTSKVVPFTGEFFYPQPDPTPQPATGNLSAFMVLIIAALAGGLAIGAIATYQRADQTELRQLQAERQQLQQVKQNVCTQ